MTRSERRARKARMHAGTAEGRLGATAKMMRSGPRRSEAERTSEQQVRSMCEGTRRSSSLLIMSAGSRTQKTSAAASALQVRSAKTAWKTDVRSSGSTSRRK
eukprot:1049273-Rhodomonas_salina.1